MNDNKENIQLTERDPQPYVLMRNFSNDELLIIQDITSERRNFIEVIPTLDNKHSVRSHQYVGIVSLPEHTIIIQPKIPDISFINMIRYVYDSPDIFPEQILLTKGYNFYDILIRMLLFEIDDILRRIPNRGFVSREGNLTYITGKILFNQQILHNPNRYDRIYCRYSELSDDILENRVIKFTLSTLMKYPLLDSQTLRDIKILMKRFDGVTLTPISRHVFDTFAFTPLNRHYRSVLNLCKLILSEESVNLDYSGNELVHTFLVNMEMLFQRFVAQVLKRYFGEENVLYHQKSYADSKGELDVIPDIMLNWNGNSSVIDTKYKDAPDKPSTDDLAQCVLYSISTDSKRSILVYPENLIKRDFLLKNGTVLSCVGFDLESKTINDFEDKCARFVTEIKSILTGL